MDFKESSGKLLLHGHFYKGQTLLVNLYQEQRLTHFTAYPTYLPGHGLHLGQQMPSGDVFLIRNSPLPAPALGKRVLREGCNSAMHEQHFQHRYKEKPSVIYSTSLVSIRACVCAALVPEHPRRLQQRKIFKQIFIFRPLISACIPVFLVDGDGGSRRCSVRPEGGAKAAGKVGSRNRGRGWGTGITGGSGETDENTDVFLPPSGPGVGVGGSGREP